MNVGFWGVVPTMFLVFGVAWVVNTWIRAKHGYPLDDGAGHAVYKGASPDAVAEQVTGARDPRRDDREARGARPRARAHRDRRFDPRRARDREPPHSVAGGPALAADGGPSQLAGSPGAGGGGGAIGFSHSGRSALPLRSQWNTMLCQSTR